MIHKLIRLYKNFKISKIKKKIQNFSAESILCYPAIIDKPYNLNVQDYVYIGPNSWISCHAKVTIQRGTIIGPRLKIYTGNHNYENQIAIPYDNITYAKKVTISENVWVGGDVIILPGVNIGEGSVIAAGSVVTKSFPMGSVIGGNPAKVIKQRDLDVYNRLKLEDKIYLKMKKSGELKLKIEALE